MRWFRADVTQSTSPADYRPDIDGLRAVAVLLVVLFHLDVPPFTGGFVGVDVFFVISGFLITRLIVWEQRAEGGFSLARFYARRARRILPALFFTVVLSAIGAFVLLSPDALERFGGSMLFSVLSLANVFFWSGTQYFDQETSKPLLHLWSLGVEEQFYLLWPLVLVGLAKRSPRMLGLGLVAIAVISLSLSGWVLLGPAIPRLLARFPSTSDWIGDGPATAFYMMPFRIFEFVTGALMVWLVAIRPPARIVLELLVLAGLALIGYASVYFTAETPFPFVNALVPCAGAALVLYAGTAPVSGRLLRNRIAVAIGLVSYSIYLLHWPLIALFRAYTYADIAPVEKAWLMVTTFVGAALMYHLVERPFRRGAPASWSAPKSIGLGVVAALLIAVPGLSMWLQGGWAWRLPEDRRALSNDEWRSREFAYCRSPAPRALSELATCQHYRGKSRNIFIWGDSHARHLVPGFVETYPQFNVYAFYLSGCVPHSGFDGFVSQHDRGTATTACVGRNREVLDFLRQQPTAIVVLSSAKRDNPEAAAPPTVYLLNQLRNSGHTAIVMGDVIRPGKELVACWAVPDWAASNSELDARCTPDTTTVRRELSFSAHLSALIPELVDVRAVQCPQGRCSFALDDGTPLFRDTHHLTVAGSIWLVDQLRSVLRIDRDGSRLP